MTKEQILEDLKIAIERISEALEIESTTGRFVGLNETLLVLANVCKEIVAKLP